jgi:DNA-binding MarR family transcriptional regulator
MRKWIGLGLLQESYTVAGLVSALVSAELEEAGVPSQLFSLLGWITLLEPVTPARLTAETGIPTTTLRDYLRLLVERGEVERRPNEADGRSYLVVTTAQGRRLSERGIPAVQRAEQAVIAGLPGDGEEHLARVLELKDAVKRALAARGLPAHAARGDLRGAPERRLSP